MIEVDVYATGVLSDLQVIGRALDPSWPRRYRGPVSLPAVGPGWRRKALRWGTQRLRRSVTRRKAWHGYHAEPRVFPPGLKRLGTGWTRARALRDLDRMVGAAYRLTPPENRVRVAPGGTVPGSLYGAGGMPPDPSAPGTQGRLWAGGQIVVTGPAVTRHDVEEAAAAAYLLGREEGRRRR